MSPPPAKPQSPRGEDHIPFAVDGLAARAVVLGEVASLQHEALDHAMEPRAFVMQRLARGPAEAALPRTQRSAQATPSI